MEKKPEKQFLEFMTEAAKTNGLDSLTSKILAILYLEPKEICLEELAKRTGYSLAAVSTTMKIIGNADWIKRMKKPKSRKVYYYVEKEIIKAIKQTLLAKYQNIILVAKEKLPGIIDDYTAVVKRTKNCEDKKKLEIIKNYYGQILQLEKIFGEMRNIFDKC